MLSATIRNLARGLRLSLISPANRWRKLVGRTPPWDDRNRLIAQFIPAGSAVIDFGAGAQTLRQHLPPGCAYQPCDLFASSPDVLPCDFNAGRYPSADRAFDVLVASGVLEYIKHADKFLARLFAYAPTAIVTFAARAAGESKLQRIGYGWVNHFTREQLEELFAQADARHAMLGQWQGHLVYRLTRSDGV